MKNMRILSAVAILACLGLGFGQEEAKGRRVIATMDSDGVQRVEITGGAYYFDPADIVVKVNVPVEFIVKKVGNTGHDIYLKAPEAGIDFKESLGLKPKTIRFTPTKVGKYPFWCTERSPLSKKSHRDRGMEGVLEVVE